MATSRKTADVPIEMTLTDVEQLRVIGDLFRLRMVEIMAEDPARAWTAKELAESLGVKQTALYHHLRLLEEHGFIRIAETRLVSGIVERRYQAAAHSFHVDHALLTGGGTQGAVAGAIDAMFTKARAEIVEAIMAGAITPVEGDPKRKSMGLWATNARLSPKSVKRVMRLVRQLAEVDSDPDAGEDAAEYGLIVGFYPRGTQETDR